MYAFLVGLQGAGVSAPASHAQVARRFGLTREQVRAVEREGQVNRWPPLVVDPAG